MDRRTALSPKDCHECFPSLCLNVSRFCSHFFAGRGLWPVPSPVLREAGFCYFLLAQSRTEVFSSKNLAARTLLEVLILRNLCRNAEHRCLEYSGHSQGLGLCHFASLATKLYYMNGNAYHLLVLCVVTRLAHPVLLTRPLLSALQLLELHSYHLCCIIRDPATQFKCCNELQLPESSAL